MSEEFADAEDPLEAFEPRPNPRLREMTSFVNVHEWRAPCANKKSVGLGIQGFTAPEEVFDGLFWVAPGANSRDQLDR